MKAITQLEAERVAIQEECDNSKTQKERNRLGQFSTPPELAFEIVQFAKRILSPREKIRFLDPAFGTGSFFSALLQSFTPNRIQVAVGYEIDRHYADKTLDLWRQHRLDLRVADFTKIAPPKANEKFNLVVCNPPYVRHHHLAVDEKTRLRGLAYDLSGIRLNGLTGLYCYFMLLADAWVGDGGICVWLIPSEFMDVNYGVPLKEYLLTKVTLLQIHRFASEDVQFGDALVSSAVVCFRKEVPSKEHEINFSFGGGLNRPRALQRIPLAHLRAESKWNGCNFRATANASAAVLSDIFDIKRGLATGDNGFFILSPEQIRQHRLPMKFFKPILPSPRYLSVNEIEADEAGNPILEKELFLLDCRLPEEEVRREYSRLWQYLDSGKNGVAKRYLCSSRSPWYLQEKRPPPLFLCTYMGRSSGKNRPAFRFILNQSKATAANVYLLLYPKARLSEVLRFDLKLARKIWIWLNAISPDIVLGEGRVYGGGLHKLEPRELGNVPADELARLLDMPVARKATQLNFFSKEDSPHASGLYRRANAGRI